MTMALGNKFASAPFTKIACKDRAEWLEQRATGIGASDAAGVLGVSPYRYCTPAAIFAQKTGLAGLDPEETEAMTWGLELEDAIARRYETVTDRKLGKWEPWTLVRSTKYPWMVATIDRLVLEGAVGIRGPLELKCANFFKRDEWAEEPPLHFQVQVAHQMIVLGCDWGSIAVLIGGQQFRWADIGYSQRFAEALIEHEARFFERVKRGEPPAADGSESYGELLKALYPRQRPGLSVPLPAEALEWDRMRLEGKALEEQGKTMRQEAENRLKAAIGEAEAGVLPDYTTYRWREIVKEIPAKDAYQQRYRELRRFEAKERR